MTYEELEPEELVLHQFYVPNGNTDRIVLTTNGHPDIRGWSDREFVNTNSGWESLGVASSSL